MVVKWPYTIEVLDGREGKEAKHGEIIGHS